MKWTLIVMVLGTTPVETGLVYDDFDTCLLAEKTMRAEYVGLIKRLREWAEKNPTAEGEVNPEQLKAVVRTFGVCVPHS